MWGMIRGNQHRAAPGPTQQPEAITVPKPPEGTWEGAVTSPLTEILEHHCCQPTAQQESRRVNTHLLSFPLSNFLLTPPIAEPSWKTDGKGVPTDVIHIPGPRAEERVNPEGKERTCFRTSLAVQWLRLSVSTAGSTGLNPGQGTKIPW